MNIKAKFQDAVNALNYGSLSAQDKKEEESCPYRIKQTKTRKTIAINCRECDAGSSLNDVQCRKNILEILQKEVQADCLVLSRLYERDYEGEALSLLYTLAGFDEIIRSYESTEKVPEACGSPEKKACELQRKEIIASFAKTVETDPLKARLEIRGFIQEKMLDKTPDQIRKNDSETYSVCNSCSELFYRMLYEIQEKLSRFPEIPAFKKSEIRALSTGQVENSKKGVGKTTGKVAGNLIVNTSGEVTLAEISKHLPFLRSANRKEKREKRKTSTDEIFDYERGIKPHVRPPFS